MNVLQECFETVNYNDHKSTSMMDNIYSRTTLPKQILKNNSNVKTELIRTTMDQIFILLKKPNLSDSQLKFIVNNLYNVLYYLLCSNRKINNEVYLLHFCFVNNIMSNLNLVSVGVYMLILNTTAQLFLN